MAEEMSLRERKKLETRAALCRAAMRVAAEEGFERLTVEAIAAAAGVSVRTFHNYFGSKEEAVFAQVTEVLLDAVHRFRDRPGEEEIWDAYQKAMLASVSELEDEWVHGIEVFRSATADPARLAGEVHRLEDIHGAGVAVVAHRTGTDPTRDLYPHLVSSAFGAVLDAAIAVWDGSKIEEFKDLLTQAIERIRQGLPQPE
ncbi:TetR/AcrR family transcriptional regulator [Streptomyces cellulosae]|uniref:TetR/AcrR family transcriptional regulator n=1 Tax=Streptomyces cellulosae TaxID=1968 RepID=UPI0004C73600|nr:TetR/AcrR family transcriptional regulator [Streptomyces cellulosae]